MLARITGMVLGTLGALATDAAQPQTPNVGDTFQDCADCPLLIVVPAGEFRLGSPQSEAVRDDDEDDAPGTGGSQLTVTIAKPFAIGAYETTYGEYAAFVAASQFDPGGNCIVDLEGDLTWSANPLGRWNNIGRQQTVRHPVMCVDWVAANAYVNWLSEKTGETYRLPSEAEWEYATRGGSSSVFPFGDNQEDLCRYANVPDAGIAPYSKIPLTACNDGNLSVAPVGQYLPNSYGLYDAIGNAWEWVEDCYQDSYEGAPTNGSPVVIPDCPARSVRGGSWGYGLGALRSANRSDDPPDTRWDGISFRVVREVR